MFCITKAGDFNSIPTALSMKIIRDHSGLIDAWTVSHDQVDTSTPAKNPQDAINRFGITADSPLNVYFVNKNPEPFVLKEFGKRLDYIFYRHPAEKYPSERPMLKCTQSRVVFTDQLAAIILQTTSQCSNSLV